MSKPNQIKPARNIPPHTTWEKVRAIDSFATTYAPLAFGFWNGPIDRAIEALEAGSNIAICAPQGIGKSGFGSQELSRRWNSQPLRGSAEYYDYAEDIRWAEDLRLAIVDEAMRFVVAPIDRINMSQYSSIPETNERLGVNASENDLQYFIDVANEEEVLLALIIPDLLDKPRDGISAKLKEYRFVVIEIENPSFERAPIEDFLANLDLSSDVIERIVSDVHAMNPFVFSDFITKILHDAIISNIDLDIEELEKGLRYWTDPREQPKPDWSRERKDDPWGEIEDDPLRRVNAGTVAGKEAFLERLRLPSDKDHGPRAQNELSEIHRSFEFGK